MASNKADINYIRGKLFWPKVLGEPVDNYSKDGKEWVFDLALDADGIKQAKVLKVLNIKDKDDERGKFLTFKQKYREVGTNEDGSPRYTKAPRVLDATGKEWDKDTKIGNGSVADVKFEIRNYGTGKYPGIYPRAIRVLDHVPYDGGNDFPELSSDDEFFRKPTADEEGFGGHTATDDLDDDVPTL